MSRLRATLSAVPIDREIQSQVAVAERALQGALRRCLDAQRGGEHPRAHVSRVRRDLENALGALRAVRRVVPYHDISDPDLLPTAPYEPPPEPPPEPEVEDPLLVETPALVEEAE